MSPPPADSEWRRHQRRMIDSTDDVPGRNIPRRRAGPTVCWVRWRAAGWICHNIWWSVVGRPVPFHVTAWGATPYSCPLIARSVVAEQTSVHIRSTAADCNLDTTSCAGGRHNMPRPLQIDLWLFDLESGVRVTCEVGYLRANFSLPRSLCFRLRPDVCDRQTSDAHHRLMPPTLGART